MAIPSKSTGVRATLLVCLLVSQARAQAVSGKPQAPVLEVARMGFVEGDVEVKKPGGAWAAAGTEQSLAMGDRVRTLRGGTARLEFPWTAVAMGDESQVLIENSRQLTLQLESGRVDVDPEQALIRVVTAEAAITGSGRTLVRRENKTTFVGSYNGGANVEAAGQIVRLGVNKSTLVSAAAPPGEATLMGAPPRVISPSANPLFARPDQDVHLIWAGQYPAYHLEILPIDSDIPVLSLDLTSTEVDVRLPWLGTFRWRVAGRTGAVESQPSGEGLICVVEK